MTTNRPTNFLCAVLGALTAVCLTACSAGIDVGQVTGTGAGTGTGGGGGGDAGLLELDPTTLDMGTAIVNTTVTQTVTLTNTSGAEVDGITAAISGNASGWFTVAGLPSTLAAGAKVTVTVSFTPVTASGEVQVSVTVSATGISPATLALTGNAVGSALQIDHNPLGFGYVPLNTTAVACATVSNIANVTVTISGTQSFANEGGAFQLATTDDATPPNPFSLPIVLAPGASAKVCFTLTPPITQDYSGQVSLVTDDPSGVNPILQLTGWGGGPQISCTPISLDFGQVTVGATLTEQVVCTNTGTAIPTTNLVLGPLTSSSGAFSSQIETLSSDGLLPGQSATIDVTYQPSGAGSDNGTLSIANNGGEGQPVSIFLSGSSVASGPDAGLFDAVQAQPTALDFGYVPLLTTAVACTTLTNVAQVGLTISSLWNFNTVGGAFTLAPFDDATPPNDIHLPTNLASGASLRLCFDLTPPITQEYVGQVGVLATTPDDGNLTLSLTGWGGGPQISCSPVSLSFDTSGETLPLDCTNSGTAIPGTGLILGALTSSSSAFSAQIVSAIGDAGWLEPGQSATIDVTYSPSGSGADIGTLQIDSNAGQGQPVSIPLAGTGP